MLDAVDTEVLEGATSDEIRINGFRSHRKASEQYVDVTFVYEDQGEVWEGSVPIWYRRTGLFCETQDQQIEALESAYDEMHPDKREDWQEAQDEFWGQKNADVTQSFFEALRDGEWTCQNCELPENPNWARRVQDLKQYGYTISTETGRECEKCGETATHLIMLRIPRGGVMGYETWTGDVRRRIINALDNYDAYEASSRARSSLLPDHKFPEIRWDKDTLEENPEDMPEEDIRDKFQLLSNQRNQQKREICRNCFQNGERGTPYGIEFFYEGGPEWPDDVPRTGAEAEEGCVGCGWYDLERWRQELNAFIKQNQ